jgi:hypothetical protein
MSTTTSWLMDAQCWLWGQDIRHPDGNLLVVYGLQRRRWEKPGDHATYYRGEFRQSTVILWSGGMLYADPSGSVALPRGGMEPKLLPVTHVDDDHLDPRGLAFGATSTALPLTDPRAANVFRWLRDYEAWVQREANDWRAGCALRWDEAEREAQRLAAEVDVEYEPLPPIPPEGLASWWDMLAQATLGSRPSMSARR